MKVFVQVNEPQPEAPILEIVIHFDINPCIVLSIINGNQVFDNHYVLLGQELSFTFQEYEQIPACNYTMSYTFSSHAYNDGLEYEEAFAEFEEGSEVDSIDSTIDMLAKSVTLVSEFS